MSVSVYIIIGITNNFYKTIDLKYNYLKIILHEI